MNRSFMKRLWMGLGLLLVALAAHQATIVLTPDLLMRGAMKRLARIGGMNQLSFPKQATETERVIVMPSPDLLYSICPYDLSQGPLLFDATLPPDTLWSLSAFDARTNNYFVVDDRQLGTAQPSIVFALASQPVDEVPGRRIVQSPSARGLLLVRTVVDRDERVAELDQWRRKAHCAPLQR